MGNEMGNRNVNGLQVSEQESNETTEAIDHSPNTSFLSLNGLDGLKGVTDYLAESLQTSEKHETGNLAGGDFSEPSLAFDDVEDQSRLNSSRENEVSDEECDEVNKESAKALTVLKDEDGNKGFPHGLPDCLPEKQGVKKVDADKSLEILVASNGTDDNIRLISSTEDDDSPDKLCNSAHTESCSERDSENQDPKENTAKMSSEHSSVSNDAEDSLQSNSSTDLRDVHEKLSDPAQSESDESLILNQIFEERGSEMDSENQDSKENTANKSFEHSAVSNDAEDPTQLISSTDNHDLHEKLGDSAGSESDESLIQKQFLELREKKDAMPWVQGTSGKCNELQDEKVERGTCGATAASKWEQKMPHEPVNAAHLDAIDNELINILLRRNDVDEEVGRQSRSEPDDKATSEEEPPMEDIESDSFDIQLNGANPCTEGREEQEDIAGLDDAMFELAIRAGYSSPASTSKAHEEDPVLEGTNGVEMGNSTLQVVTPVADNKHDRESIECGSNKLPELSIVSMVSENGTEMNGDENEEGSECPNGEVNGHAEVVAADELADPTIAAASTGTPTSPPLVEEVVQKCSTATEAEEALANKEELFTIDILRRDPSENEKRCAQPSDPEALEGCGSIEDDSSAAESVKCVTYEYERSSNPEAEESTLSYTSKTEESKQNPPFSHEACSKNRRLEVSAATEENIREYRVSTSQEDISPLLCRRKSEDGRVSAEETDSEKPRTPFLNFLKEGVSVKESVEKEGLLQKKAAKESKKSATTSSSTSREKQKPRSSLFSSCMCCTTAIN